MNSVNLTGRLTKDIDLRKTQSNLSVCQFTLAVKKQFVKEGQLEADFISCQAWRQSADYLAKYASKGDKIEVTGKLATRNYDDKDGKKVYVTEVVCESVEICSLKNKQGNIENAIEQQTQETDNSMFGGKKSGLGSDLEISSDDLPFY